MNDRPFTIYVVEDNEWFNKLLAHILSLNPDYQVKTFLNANEFLKCLDEAPHVVTLDYRLPEMDGIEVLKKIKAYNPDIEVIIVSEQNNIETAVELLKHGAYDYIAKGKDIRERLHSILKNIQKNIHLKNRIQHLETEIQSKYDFQNSIIGNSPALLKTLELVKKAIATNVSVTISGETGTGKEVIAKAIHYNSSRKNKLFVPVNVAAIPAELIESELFGHEKGAFTGAAARRIGKFEEADGGTLFLDEIGEMDLSVQAKLLRALQEKEITRVGNNTPIKVDCRIIVATHRDLKTEIKNGKFREDLYYRLFGLPIELAPLRQRGNDIITLSKYFLEKFCRENKIPERPISAGAQKKLLTYEFPGNIRELKSIIELAMIMGTGNEILPEDITLNSSAIISNVAGEELKLREYDFKILNIFLQKYNNDIKLVAKKLGIGQSTIYRMLKEK